MASPHFADLRDNGTHTSGAMFGAFEGGRDTFIGVWSFARPAVMPSGHADIPDLPHHFDSATDSPEVRLDKARSNGLMSRPLRVFKAFQYARSSVIELMKADNALHGRGYSVPARIDGLKSDVKAATRGAMQHVEVLDAARLAVDAAEAEACRTFPATTENDMAQAMNDAAIVARLGELTPQDLASLAAGELSPRLADPRVIQALQRVPQAATGVDAETLRRLSLAYAHRFQTLTMEAVELVRQMIDAAMCVMTSLFLACARLTMSAPRDMFAFTPGGRVFESLIPRIGVGVAELASLDRAALAYAARATAKP